MLPLRRPSPTRFFWRAAASAEVGQVPIESQLPVIVAAQVARAAARAPAAAASIATNPVVVFAAPARAAARAPAAAAAAGGDARLARRRSARRRRSVDQAARVDAPARLAGAVTSLPDMPEPPRRRRRR